MRVILVFFLSFVIACPINGHAAGEATSGNSQPTDAGLYRLLFPGPNCLGERMENASDNVVDRTIALDALLAAEADAEGLDIEGSLAAHHFRETVRVRRELYTRLVFEPEFQPDENALLRVIEEGGLTDPQPELVTFNHLHRRIPPGITEEKIEAERLILLEAKAEVENGTSFLVVAARYNDTAEWRGRIPNIPVEKTKGVLKEYLENLDAGEWSDIFESPTGINLIQIAHKNPAAEARPLITRERAEEHLFHSALKGHIAEATRTWAKDNGLQTEVTPLQEDPKSNLNEPVVFARDIVLTVEDVLANAGFPEGYFTTKSPGDIKWEIHIQPLVEDLWLQAELIEQGVTGVVTQAPPLTWVDNRVKGFAWRQNLIDSVSDDELRNELEENRDDYSHSVDFRLERILIPIQENNHRAARLAGEEIRQRWTDGGNPEDLALEHGFEYVHEKGFTNRHQLYDRLEYLLLSVREGGIAGPVLTQSRYEVVKVLERRKSFRSEDVLETRARRRLGNERFRTQAEELLYSLQRD